MCMLHSQVKTMTSKNEEKKVRRKQRRAQQMINAETNVECCDESTEHLVVCNAGLVTGLRQELLLNELERFGAVDDIVMLKGKSYCFVRCSDASNAKTIYENVHGRSELGQNDGPLYLSFCKKIPANEEVVGTSTPDGLVLLEDFVTEEEETSFLDLIDWKQEADAAQSLKHRLVKHFGYEFRYDNNRVDVDKPLDERIPGVCYDLFQRLQEKQSKVEIPNAKPDQLTVNKYEPGQGIPPHVDTHSVFLDPIVVLSLAGDVVMDWTQTKSNVQENRRESVLVQRRSLMIMSGESRLGWTHGITPRKFDIIKRPSGSLTSMQRSCRVSFTFRWLKHDPCKCNFPWMCDSQKPQFETTRNESKEIEMPSKLEEENVHKVYNEIANHFSETRHSPWPRVEQFLKSFELGSVLVDIGCGNGKYLSLNENIAKIGCDRSHGLLKVCRERQLQVFECDCLNVPVRSCSVDGAISIAVIHHLASDERRIRAIAEMARILRPNGRALIYVWAKNQAVKTTSSYLRQNRKNFTDTKEFHDKLTPKNQSTNENHVQNVNGLPVHTNRTQFVHQDVLVPWKLKGEKKVIGDDEKNSTFLRYYHVFEEGELEKLCKKVENLSFVESYYDQGNWCIIFEKKNV